MRRDVLVIGMYEGWAIHAYRVVDSNGKILHCPSTCAYCLRVKYKEDPSWLFEWDIPNFRDINEEI